MALFLQLRWFFLRHRRAYGVALALLAAVALLNMAVPWLVGRLVDQLVAGVLSGASVQRYGLLLLGLGLLVYLLRVAWRLVLFGTSYRLGNLLRAQLYGRLLRQGPGFFAVHSAGDLMAQATHDIDAVELAAGEGVLSGFDGLLTLVLVLLMMLAVIDWRLTLVALLPFPLMGWAFYRISHRVHARFGESLELFSELNARVQESLSCIRLIKAEGLEDRQAQAFSSIAAQASASSLAVARAEALYDPVVFLSLTSALGLALAYGAWLIHGGQLSLGELASFSLYLGQLIWPMFAFGWLLNIAERGSAAYARVSRLLATPESVADAGSGALTGVDLSVRALHFAYPGGEESALAEVSFELPAGHWLGIAGPTGAGKSTLLQVLMRCWESEPGQVRIGGQAVQQLALTELRRAYAYVPQEPFLFAASIADNIALAHPTASQADIAWAARTAAIATDIEAFPDGYATLVGERGVTLSGGQRQRLAIARALLSPAPILVLDDALSAVDLLTERRILEALQREVATRTCILVSHRLSALVSADQVLVLGGGRICERGTHAELVARDGWYGRMWAYQQMEAVLDGH